MKACSGLIAVLALLLVGSMPSARAQGEAASPAGTFTGSSGCRSCHEKFYKLWSSSFHGLAMQAYSNGLAKAHLTGQDKPLTIGGSEYLAKVGAGEGYVLEKTGTREKKFPVSLVLGGKDVYYFLTPLQKGRLQTLPLAYDVRQKQWYDMAGSGSRHFPGETSPGVTWKDWPYTFNTGCYGCHVSQLSTNYDAKTDAYHTTWTEPGINCETCHGPGQEHIKVCQAAPKDQPPADLKTIRGGRNFSHDQQNALCASCHAKVVPLTTGMAPGDKFFDHFDLVTFESPDYYPDGRDLGENYTFTSWSRSPCVRSGQLDCLHCHTSSGRYKFADPATANQACSPCHAERVANAPAHTHHPAGSPGNRCVSCHMPMTVFARMRRSDHSMLPPTPAATVAFGSPNACNGCHADKDAAWADKTVRAWHADDYQAPVLRLAGLVKAARAGDWSRLTEMLDYLTSREADPIQAASLIRLVRFCPDPRKNEALLAAATSPSPLVRAAVAEDLAEAPTPAARTALVAATSDATRLVRVRAAAALAGLPREDLAEGDRKAVDRATAEYLKALAARPDLWTSAYNLGNFALAQGDPQKAVAAFATAARLDPTAVPPLVNASIALSRLGDTAKAQAVLAQALAIDPGNAPALFNRGLLRAEGDDLAGAEKDLRAALARDPGLAEAAYNLGVLLARTHPQEGLGFCRQAATLRPDRPKYAYTLAYFLYRAGDGQQAALVLGKLIAQYPGYGDALVLLGQIQKNGSSGRSSP